MALADSFDSSPANAFKVTIDGIEIPKVTEVSGLKNEVDKIELKQQTRRRQVRRPPAHRPGEDRGVHGHPRTHRSQDHHRLAEGRHAGRRRRCPQDGVGRSCSTTRARTLKKYDFRNCWVRSVEINSLKAGATEQATEKFTVCFDESEVT